MADLHQLVLLHGREAARDMVPERDRPLVDLAAEIMGNESLDLGFTYAGFAMTALPHRDPKVHRWERRNGRCSLLIKAGELYENGRFVEVGLPFGSRARLILIYLQTEAIRRQSRIVSLGSSLHDWMRQLGIPIGGKSYGEVRKQARRLSACEMTLGFTTQDGREGTTSARIVETIMLEPAKHGGDGGDVQGALWDDTVQLSTSFYELLERHPVPVYEPALRALSNNSAALDLYVWMAYRLHAIEAPTPISWARVYEQFGASYATMRQFRYRFAETLKLALAVYPDADVRTNRHGLMLHPSPPAVPKPRSKHLRAV